MPVLVRRTRALALAVAVGIALLSVTGQPAAADSGTPSPRTAPGTTLVGAYVGADGGASTEEAVRSFEGQLGRRLDVQRWYARWDDDLTTGSITTVADRGRVLMLSILPKRADGSTVSWASIARGDVDAQIRAQAAAVRGLGPIVYLTLHHEPELAAASYGTAADYRAAWRHYVEVFAAERVTTVLWTWIASVRPFAAGATATPDFYPGDDVVDRVGVDAYNAAGCTGGSTTSWHSLGYLVAGFRAFAAAHGKPAVLAEFGSVTDPGDWARRSAWLGAAFDLFAGWPQLEAAVYFDAAGSCDWRLPSGTTSLHGFAAAAARPAAHGRPAAWLIASQQTGAGTVTESFDLSGSTGAASAARTGIAGWRLDPGDGSPVLVGSGQPTGRVTHAYTGPGWYAPTLTVTDLAGATATDQRSVHVVALPRITGSTVRELTASTATLMVWVATDSVTGSVRLQWSAAGTVGGSATVPVTAVGWAQTVRVPVTGLAPGTAYSWTATATTMAGSSNLTRSFATTG